MRKKPFILATSLTLTATITIGISINLNTPKNDSQAPEKVTRQASDSDISAKKTNTPDVIAQKSEYLEEKRPRVNSNNPNNMNPHNRVPRQQGSQGSQNFSVKEGFGGVFYGDPTYNKNGVQTNNDCRGLNDRSICSNSGTVNIGK